MTTEAEASTLSEAVDAVHISAEEPQHAEHEQPSQDPELQPQGEQSEGAADIIRADDEEEVEREQSAQNGASSQPIKLFIGGLPATVRSDDVLREHFEQFGQIEEAVLRSKTHQGKGDQRGYGFVTVRDKDVARLIMEQEHVIDGTALPAPMLAKPSASASGSGKAGSGRGVRRSGGQPSDAAASNGRSSCLKVFVGGLPHDVTEAAFKSFFEQFGPLSDTVIMYDYATRRPRGFGFVTFTERASVDKLLANRYYELNGCRVEVKEAVPREKMRKEGMSGSQGSRKDASKASSSSAAGGYDDTQGDGAHGYGYDAYVEPAVSPTGGYGMMYPNGHTKGGSPPSYSPSGAKPMVPTGIPVQPGIAPPMGMQMHMQQPYGPGHDGGKVPVMSMPMQQYQQYMQVQHALPVQGGGMYHGVPVPYDMYGNPVYSSQMHSPVHAYQPIGAMAGGGAPESRSG